MRGKTVIRCTSCNAGSDVRLILVFRGIKKCMSCAAVAGIMKEGYETESPEEALKRINRHVQEPT